MKINIGFALLYSGKIERYFLWLFHTAPPKILWFIQMKVLWKMLVGAFLIYSTLHFFSELCIACLCQLGSDFMKAWGESWMANILQTFPARHLKNLKLDCMSAFRYEISAGYSFHAMTGWQGMLYDGPANARQSFVISCKLLSANYGIQRLLVLRNWLVFAALWNCR